MRWWRAIGAAGGLLMVLAGWPYLLVEAMRMIWPELDWASLVAQPLTLPTVLAAATVVGWVLWLWLLYAVLAEAIDQVRHRAPRRPRLPVPLHAAVTHLTGTAVLLTNAVAGRASPPATAPPAPTPAAAPVVTAADPAAGSAMVVVAERDHDRRGIALPGGWLPLPAAMALAAAGTAWLLHRNRRYRPRPPGPARRDDPAVEAVPAPLALLRHRLDTAIDEPTDELATQVLLDDPSVVAVGARGRRWLSLHDLPPGGLGLTGPGALSTIRGLVVTVLTANASANHGHTAVVISRPDLRRLFGDAEAMTGLPDARPVADQLAALTVLATVPDPANGSWLLVQLEPPNQEQINELTALLDRAAGRANMIFLGAWPLGTTWPVAGTGTVLPSPDTRLGLLDQPTATTMLAVLRQVHQPSPARTSSPPVTPEAAGATPAAAGQPDWSERPPGDAARRQLLLRVLGPVTVLVPHPDGSHSPVRIRRSAGRSILAYLAAHRTATTDELNETLWPDTARSLAVRRLAVTLSELRGALHTVARAPVLRQETLDDRVGRHRFWLDPQQVRVDLWRLQALLDTAHHADPSTGHTLLQQVVDLPHGVFAEDVNLDWVHPQREATTRDLIDVYTHLADVEPDHLAAIALLRTALQFAPHHEATYQALMRRTAATGDHDGVYRALATLTERLADHHTAPAADTHHLVAELTNPAGTPSTLEQWAHR